MSENAAPLILTLALDDKSQQFFDELRERYFPPERNYLQAHLTLFHHLPGHQKQSIEAYLSEIASRHEPLSLEVSEVKMIGRGVAYKIESKTLISLHRQLAKAWKEWLTPQDRQKLWPHITVQNKVEPAKARALHEKLAENFEPFTANGTGLKLWEYQSGPWKWFEGFSFLA